MVRNEVVWPGIEKTAGAGGVFRPLSCTGAVVRRKGLMQFPCPGTPGAATGKHWPQHHQTTTMSPIGLTGTGTIRKCTKILVFLPEVSHLWQLPRHCLLLAIVSAPQRAINSEDFSPASTVVH